MLPYTVPNHILMGLSRQSAEPVRIEILNRPDPHLRIGHDVTRPDAGIERAEAPPNAIQIGHAAGRLFVVVVPENGGILIVHIPDSGAVLAEVLLPFCVPPPEIDRAAGLAHALERRGSAGIHRKLNGRLVTEVLRPDGRVVLGLIAPIHANPDILPIRDRLHKDRLDGDVGMHRCGDRLSAERHDDAWDVLPKRISPIHWNRALDHLSLNGDRLADSQGDLSQRPDHAHDQDAQEDPPYHAPVPRVNDFHSDSPSSLKNYP